MDNDDELLDTTWPLRSRMMLDWPAKSILRRHQFVDTTVDVIDRNLPDQLYPKNEKQKEIVSHELTNDV